MSDLNLQIKDVLIKALELEDITPADIDDDAPLFGKDKEGKEEKSKYLHSN